MRLGPSPELGLQLARSELLCAVELELDGSALQAEQKAAEILSLQVHCWVQRGKTVCLARNGFLKKEKKAVHHPPPLAPDSTPELVLGRCVGERRPGEAQRVKMLLGSCVLKVLQNAVNTGL